MSHAKINDFGDPAIKTAPDVKTPGLILYRT